MNYGKESETLEFKKTTAEIEKSMCNIASMLNKYGHGTVLFGVNPKGEVVGQDVSEKTLNDVAKKIMETIRPVIYPSVEELRVGDKTIVKVSFSGNEKPYSAYGRYYKRVHDRTEEMTPGELKAMMASTDTGSLWEDHLTNFGLDDVDHEALHRFYNKSISCGRIEEMPRYNEEALLSSLGLMVNGCLTNAGYYLFSNRKPVVLKTAVYVTDERITFSDLNRFEDNIYNLKDRACQYIMNHINWRVEGLDGTSRIEIPEVPMDAIREIVVNSFSHADYRGVTEHEIDITPSQIEIYNPGEFPENLSPQMFVDENIKSMPRNKVILNTLYKSKDVEVFGSGFRKTYYLCKKNRIDCSYKSGHGGFSFIFKRKENKFFSDCVSESSPSYGTKELRGLDEIVLNSLRLDPKKTRAQIALENNKSVRTIQRSIDSLVSKGLINRVGSNKTGYWEIGGQK